MSEIHNLPIATPTLDGRQEEASRLEHLLKQSRLITLTGAPGVGKTHLAATVAASQKDLFPDGIHYINLAATRRWVIILGVIAEALRLPISPQQALPQLNEQLLKHLKDKRCLLFLDSFEHLLPASILLEQLLSRCPKVKLLVTSRAPLKSSSEQLLVLGPLATPATSEGFEAHPEGLLKIPAAALFVGMVQQHVPSFVVGKDNVQAVAQLCQELDGLPFALELAASQLEKQAPAALLKELSGPYLPDWEVNADPQYFQHSNLREAWQWSYDLLNDKQRLVLRHAHMFAGGFLVDALSYILGTDKLIAEDVKELLEQLVNKHLLTLENSHKDSLGEPRFRLLNLTRRFAYEQFERLDDLPQSHLRYLEYYQQTTPPDEAWLGLEHPNIEAALGYLKDAYHDYDKSFLETFTGLLGTARQDTSVATTPELEAPTLEATEGLESGILNAAAPALNDAEGTSETSLTNPSTDLGTDQEEVFESRKRQKEPLYVALVKSADDELAEELTEREQEVLRLVAMGLSNREVAEKLEVSPRTVGAHLANIFSKLNVKTRTAAVRKAVTLDLQPNPSRL
jgi:predicted ATPase/DNA-binding CsgD family transcriptional regulator